MRIGRTLPPAAAPIYLRDIISGIKGLFQGKRELERFETELKEYFGVKYCFLVSSGKAALTLILTALREMYPERHEVLIPAFTCYSVPSAIVRAGLKIRLCDIDASTLDFDFDQMATILSQFISTAQNKSNENSSASSNAILESSEPSSRLLAIIPTHLFGLSADLERVRKLVDGYRVVIVEDAAQAFGGECNGKKLGTLGDVNFFSLGRGKSFTTVEGGIILTNREDIAGAIGRIKRSIPGYKINESLKLILHAIALAFFVHPRLFWFPKLFPFLKLGETIYDPNFEIRTMSFFQAGMTRGWQGKLTRIKKIRAGSARQCLDLIRATRNDELIPMSCKPNSDQIYANLIRFPLRTIDASTREKILEESDRKGLGIMGTYPDAINGIEELKNEFLEKPFLMAKEQADSLITFPVHPFVTQKDWAEIASLISKLH